jgi:hypothetical protein
MKPNIRIFSYSNRIHTFKIIKIIIKSIYPFSLYSLFKKVRNVNTPFSEVSHKFSTSLYLIYNSYMKIMLRFNSKTNISFTVKLIFVKVSLIFE